MLISELTEHRDDFRRTCRARGLSPRTTSDYIKAVNFLIEWFEGTEDREINTGDLKDYMADLVERKVNVHKSRHRNPSGRTVSKKYALGQFTSLQQFFKWAVAEQLCVKTIWVGMVRPKVEKKPVPIIGEDALSTLVKHIESLKPTETLDRFLKIRDEAIIRFFIDTGVRVGDLVSMTIAGVDYESDTAVVIGKGNKQRTVPFGDKTALAMRRYDRVRKGRRQADTPEYWIGRQGPLTTQGVREIIERRCKEAGIAHINPHRFRHTAAHNWLDAGLSENGLSQIMGWDSPQMLRVYATSAASSRAVREHQRAGLGNRF